ncbi:unnamed protein product, partial [Leptidea sinapis]
THKILIKYIAKRSKFPIGDDWSFLDFFIIAGESIFIADVFISCLHAFWPVLRLYIRVYRRSNLLFAYDLFSLLPLTVISKYRNGYDNLLLLGRWLDICRIYRMYTYFQQLNTTMGSSRIKLYIIEHVALVLLLLHGCTCLWYSFHDAKLDELQQHLLGFSSQINIQKLQFNRWSTFVDQTLTQQAAQYKQQLWRMKDGVLTSQHLKQLPLAFQMELIFDINVGHFHDSLLLRDTAGQYIWNQGVVKPGLICVKRGVIEMLSDEDDESPMIAFKKGTVLGEVSLFISIPSKVSVKAATYVELQNAIIRCDQNDSRLIRTRYRPMKVLKDHLWEEEEEDPTFVDDSHMYYKDENNVRHRKFTKDYLELYQITNNVTTVDSPRLRMAESDRNYHDGRVITQYLYTVDYCDCLKIGFYLDVLSVFPAYIFTDTMDPKGETFASHVAVLFPILQVWHIWDYIGKWQKRFNSNAKFLCFLNYSLLFLIFCYWSGCLLYLTACPNNLCKEDSWLAQLIYWESKVYVTKHAKHEMTLMSSFAFGTAMFTGSESNFGTNLQKITRGISFVPISFNIRQQRKENYIIYSLKKEIKESFVVLNNRQERKMYVQTFEVLGIMKYLKSAFILDILTVFPFEELVTRIIGTFSYWERDIMRVNQAVILMKFLPLAVMIVNSVTALIFLNGCTTILTPESYYITAKCTKHAALESSTESSIISDKCCGSTSITFTDNLDVTLEICRDLNSALMEDTLVFMYEKALREVPLFGKVERSFIRVITQHLHEMYFLKGDTVVQCKDIQKHIYIIYRGKVDVLSSYNEMITCMGPGGMFGNFTGVSHNSVRGSQSTGDVSQAKSGTSVGTYQSYMDVNNLLKPGSRLFQSFGYLTSIMATLSYILTLYEVITLNDCNIIVWLQSFFDIFFYIKIYLSMHQGFVSRNGELVMNAVRCRKRYYKHKLWVWTDLFANLPLELFGFCFTNPLVAMHYFRINKLLRLKYLIEFYRKTSAELTNNLTTLQRLWDYTSSLYVIVSELTTTGGDEFVLDQTVSMMILSICLVCGKLLASTVVATSIQIAYSIKYTLNNYEKYTKELMDVLKNQGLSTYQMNKFSSYTRQLWLPELIKQSPYVLKCDLMSAMFGQHLRNCYIFADTGEPFLRQLTVRNYIVVAGDSEARMQWISSGTVAVLSVRADLTETTHELYLLSFANVDDILRNTRNDIIIARNKNISNFKKKKQNKSYIFIKYIKYYEEKNSAINKDH